MILHTDDGIPPLYNRTRMTDSTPRKLIIAIDGPAGAGKSTIASRLARKLGYVNLESGAMYRALALKAIEWDVSFDDEDALAKLAEKSRIKIEPTMGGNRVFLDGRDVTPRVRETDVSQAASRVSVHPEVREWMVARQRELGAAGGVVMEGRDIGTKVFPDADIKIFLDADPVIARETAYSTGALARSLRRIHGRRTARTRPPRPHPGHVTARTRAGCGHSRFDFVVRRRSVETGGSAGGAEARCEKL